jgi:hypothetical protein
MICWFSFSSRFLRNTFRSFKLKPEINQDRKRPSRFFITSVESKCAQSWTQQDFQVMKVSLKFLLDFLRFNSIHHQWNLDFVCEREVFCDLRFFLLSQVKIAFLKNTFNLKKIMKLWTKYFDSHRDISSFFTKTNRP